MGAFEDDDAYRLDSYYDETPLESKPGIKPFLFWMISFILLIYLAFVVLFSEPGIVEPPVIAFVTSTSYAPITSTTLIVPMMLKGKSSDELMSNLGQVQEIVESRNTSACDSIEGMGLLQAREMCHYTIAVSERNLSKCESIYDNTLRETCLNRIKYFLDPHHPKEIINTTQSGGQK